MSRKRKKLIQNNAPKKNPAGAPVSLTINQLDVQPFNRGDKDTSSWKNALQSAESRIPRRSLLYDLYADVDLNGHVEAVTSKRRDAVTTANWQFLDEHGKPVDAINEVIDSIGFETILEEIINSKFWGYSMMEPKFFKDHTGRWEVEPCVVPKKNMRPHLGVIAYDSVSDDGINIRVGLYAKTVMEVGKPDDLGLYLKAAPYHILERGGLGDYAMFVQVFGNPLVDATWDGFDEDQRLKLLEAIKILGSGGGLVRPAGTTVQLLDKKSNANGDLQSKFISGCQKGMSKALLGTTETIEASEASGYAQSKTHENQDNKKHETDLQFTRRILNSRFTKILAAHGFEPGRGTFDIQGEETELTKEESFEIHKSLKTDLGLPISDDFFYETYGVPKPDNYDQLKKEAKPDPENKPQKEPPKKEKEPADKADEKEVTLVDRSIFQTLKNLFSFFVPAPKEGANQKTMNCCGEAPIIKLSTDVVPNLYRLIDSVALAEGSGYFYPELFRLNAGALTVAFQKGWKGEQLVKLMEVGVKYDFDDPQMKSAWEMNIFKFSAIKAAYQSEEVNALFRQAKNLAEFERLVRKLYGVQNKQHLLTEYNTAFQVGQSASTYYRLLTQMDTFPYWEIRTIGDDRVRNSHRPLHGRVLPANHSIFKILWPPFDWNCRCYIVPRLAEEVSQAKVNADVEYVTNFISSSPAWEKSRANGFGRNQVYEMEVFSPDQQYSKTPDKEWKNLGGMGLSIWGLLSLTEMQSQAKDKPDIEEPLTNTNQDYSGRVVLGEPTSSVITDPDEVWVKDEIMTYIKHYTTESLQVVASLSEKGELVAIDSGRALEVNRSGVLIKS